MNTPITLIFSYTDDDLRKGHKARHALLSGPLALEILVIFALIGLLFEFSLLNPGNLRIESLLATLYMIGLGGFVLQDRLLGGERMVDQFRANARMKTPQRLTFSDTFIEDETEKLKCSWSCFQMAYESSESFLLFLDTKRKPSVIIPKRVFVNSKQQEQFAQLVSEKLPLKTRCRNRTTEQHSS